MLRRWRPHRLVAALLLAGGGLALGQEPPPVAPVSGPAAGPLPETWGLGPALFFGGNVYEGRDPVLIPVPAVWYRGDRCSIAFERGECRLASKGRFRFDALGALRLAGYRESDSPALEGMANRNPSVDLGFQLELRTPAGYLEVDLLADVLDQHDGQAISASWHVPIVTRRWLVKPDVAVHWLSAATANYYYGVRAEEARPGRPSYEVGDTAVTTLTVVATYRFAPRWMVMASSELKRLSDAVRDSPLVESRTQMQIFAGTVHLF